MNIHPSWQVVPAIQQNKPQAYLQKIKLMRQNTIIYPAQNDIFRAFALVPLTAVKVIILGQDPYHGAGQADGLSFSVPEKIKTPPSLRNIFKEIQRDCYSDQPGSFSSDLTRWAKQGVFLLNTVLTVEAGKAGSHRKILGWERFTDEVIQTISNQQQHCVFMLWGNAAQSKINLINPKTHCVLTTSHPSPLGAYRGFNGSGHFSQANRYLIAHQKKPINW